jgi:Zn-finger protein
MNHSIFNAPKCPCGKEGRYTRYENGKEVFSCNKYFTCLSYEEQSDLIEKLRSEESRRVQVLPICKDCKSRNIAYTVQSQLRSE